MSNQTPISPRSSSQVDGLPSEPGKVLTLAGLVFALVGLLAAFVVVLSVISLPGPRFPVLLIVVFLVGIVSSIAGVILSVLGLRSPWRRALARVGLTLSIVVFVLFVLLMLALILLVIVLQNTSI